MPSPNNRNKCDYILEFLKMGTSLANFMKDFMKETWMKEILLIQLWAKVEHVS